MAYQGAHIFVHCVHGVLRLGIRVRGAKCQVSGNGESISVIRDLGMGRGKYESEP